MFAPTLQIGLEQITPLISNVGFPIAAFVLMWHLSRETINEHTKAVNELQTEISSLENSISGPLREVQTQIDELRREINDD